MNNEIKLSIIIPCYNAELYIDKAIDSIINQNYKNWELILINDGSIDKTQDILQRYSSNDNRIKVINSNNGGVSKARNLGLEKVTGNWILFLDADDWYELNAFNKIVERISTTSADVIGFNHFYNYKNKEWKRHNFKPTIIERCNNEIEWLKCDTLFPYYDQTKNNVFVGSIRGVWSKAFNIDVIKNNNIKFIEGLKIAEDAIFCLDVFNKSKRVVLYNDYLIHHRIHPSSVMNKYIPNVIEINNFSLNEYLKRKSYFDNPNDFNICFLGMISECIFRMFKLFLLKKDCKYKLSDKLKILRNVTSSDIYKNYIDNTTYDFLPLGKKQIISSIKKKQFIIAYIVAYISKKYLELTNRISN